MLRFRGPVPKDRVWTAKDDAITLSPLFGMPGGRHTIGVARHWHFIFDILFVLNGIVYVVLLFATGRYLKLVPTQLSILPDAASCVVQYSALHLPTAPGGYFRFDAIQQLSYFGVVFLLGPLAILSGLAMSPALDNRFKFYQRIFGNRQAARTLHFLIMCAFLAFYAVHMTMVASTGFASNLDSITLGTLAKDLNGVALLFVALGVTIAFNVWAVRFSWTHTRVLQRISNATVGRLMDLLFDHSAPRAEYREQDISPFFWPNGTGAHQRRMDRACAIVNSATTACASTAWSSIRSSCPCRSCATWPTRSRSRMHNCIQGWSAIGKWSGVPFAKLIELVQPTPGGRVGHVLLLRRGRRGRAVLRLALDCATSATRRACSPTR